jgi:hypothetical protein
MISTGGTALSEERLRAYFKCSQFFHFGGKAEASIENRMAQIAIEYYISAKLRSPERDRAYLVTKAIFHAAQICKLNAKYLVGQKQQLVNQTTLWLDEFLQLFNPEVYFPVTGPLPWRTTVSKTAIDLHMSGVFRTAKNQTLHVISFSPFIDRHSQLNDPISHLKIQALQAFVKANPNRPKAIIHTLWAKRNGALGIDQLASSIVNPDYIKAITAKVQQAERAEHIPLLPCPHDCKFKNKCYPGAKK